MSSRVARSAGIISLATAASRVLGVVRETVLAYYFGASASMQMDAYNVAFRFPSLLRDLFAEGAMTAAFVPAFTRTLGEGGREHAWRLGNLAINALLIVTAILVLLGVLFAAPVTAAIAPEFATVPGKLELTTELTRVMLPFLMTLAAAVVMMGMLNSLQRFFIPSVSPAMFNVASILCAVALVPVMPWLGLPPIMAIAFGTLLGGVGQIAVQVPALRREGFRYRPIVDFRDPDLLRVLRTMLPGTLGVAAVNINVLINTYMATGEEQGAVSWLGYAFRVLYLPIGLFGVSVATAVLPDLSRHAAGADFAAIRHTVSSALRLTAVLNVPAMVGLVVLAEPIIALLYERGQFTGTDTTATAAALMFYAPGLLGYSMVRIVAPAFYALGDSRTPVFAAIATVLLNLGLNLALVGTMGFRGLALGTAAAAALNAGVLLWLLSRRLGGLDGRRVWTVLVKMAIASTIMAAVAAGTITWLSGAIPGGSEGAKAVRVFGSIGAAVAALAVSARLLRLEELSEAARRVIQRVGASAR